ncbi:MAG: tRNA (adenosine(37)-N6)-dimethylallyltransferase MiaA [bacterium]|nr:tRNA (adenosine(37)-N6)-dimethylallyltransferase MiaA [bacterium]
MKTLSARSKKSSPRSATSARSTRCKPNVIAIVGPTGSGKTALAIALIRRFGGAVISADSRQLYRDMDIGTAKPTKAEQRRAKHYMIDIISPNQRYSAGRFQKTVYALVKKLYHAHPDQPIFLVGGTYLYVDAVRKGWDFAQTKADPGLRRRLERATLKQLAAELRKKDPTTARSIDMRNRRRLIRALEVVRTTGKSFYDQRTGSPPAWNMLSIGLDVPQKKLDLQNARRIDRMFCAGWTSEVKKLLRRYKPSTPGFYAHGYREVVEYLEGKRSLADTKKRIAINTRRHAKRQLTWFKKSPDTHWIKATDSRQAAKLVSKLQSGIVTQSGSTT